MYLLTAVGPVAKSVAQFIESSLESRGRNVPGIFPLPDDDELGSLS